MMQILPSTNKSELTYGPPIPLLQANVIRQEQSIHGKTEKKPLPLPISTNHKSAHLYMDLFYVNSMDFLHTKSIKINLPSDQHCISHSTG